MSEDKLLEEMFLALNTMPDEDWNKLFDKKREQLLMDEFALQDAKIDLIRKIRRRGDEWYKYISEHDEDTLAHEVYVLYPELFDEDDDVIPGEYKEMLLAMAMTIALR
jgi:hypothetical protein